MILTSKPITDENFEYLIQRAPINSLREVLKGIVTCYDIQARSDFASRVLIDYHHANRTLVVSTGFDIVLTPYNMISRNKEYKFNYLDYEYINDTKKAVARVILIDTYLGNGEISREPTKEELIAFEIPSGVFDRFAFRQELKAKYKGRNVATSFTAKMKSKTELVVVSKVKYVESKT